MVIIMILNDDGASDDSNWHLPSDDSSKDKLEVNENVAKLDLEAIARKQPAGLDTERRRTSSPARLRFGRKLDRLDFGMFFGIYPRSVLDCVSAPRRPQGPRDTRTTAL